MKLTQDMIDMLAAGVAHQVGGCTGGGRPVVCRGLAAQMEEDGRLAVILSGESGFEVLAAIRETGRVSVNFTHPGTFQSLNLTGRDAVVVHGGTKYRALVDARHRAFRDQIAPYGFPAAYSTAWYNPPDEDLMAILFTPIIARNQTPGPGAGNALELRS
jgi:hypothetical protein